MLRDEFEKKNRQRMNTMRSVLDYAMGAIICLAGGFFLLRGRLDLPLNGPYPPNWVDQAFGVLCLLYGGWRIYRGYKKNYYG